MLPEIGFHDSSLLSIAYIDSRVIIELEGAQIPKNGLLELVNATLCFSGARELKIDGVLQDEGASFARFEDCGVFRLIAEGGIVTISLLLEGHFPSTQHELRFFYESVNCDISEPFDTAVF